MADSKEKAFSFEIKHKDTATNARVGLISTPHGQIETPIFAPVGTQATVKSLTPEQIKSAGAQMILANTYHLYLRPRAERVAKAGGIHKFMACNLPIMTDSGGFQVFSLGSSLRDGVGKIANIFPQEATEAQAQNIKQTPETLVKITEQGVQFRSHIDGSLHFFDPEKSMEIQSLIGADFVLAFDECTSPLDDHAYTKQALERTHRWATRSLEAYKKYSKTNEQAFYGIVQGGAYQDLREISADFLNKLPCFGYSIGGSLGKSKADMFKVLEWTIPGLPETAPRHLLGIGEIEDIFECVARGIDTFDCVIPTRWARTAAAMVSPARYAAITSQPTNNSSQAKPNYRINLRNAQFVEDYTPIDPTCTCYTCQKFTKAYLSHLYRTKELLVYTLVSIHNIHFLSNLMADIRDAITNNQYQNFKQNYFRNATV